MSRPHDIAARIRASLRGPTATTTAGNLLILGSNAASGVVSARALGPDGRGELAVVLLWSALISMAGGFGLSPSCSYHIARWPDRRAALAAWLTRIAARQVLAMTAVSAAVMWLLYFRLGLDALLASEYTMWAGAAAVALYGACYAQGVGDFTRFNVIRVAPNVAAATLMVAGAATLRLTPAEAGAAYLLPTCGGAVLAGAWLLRAKGTGPLQPLSRQERRAMWSYGWRSLASFSGLTLNNIGDQLALGLIVPVGSLGLYSVAASASAPLASLISAFAMVALPVVAALSGRQQADAAWRIFRRAGYLLGVISPVVALCLPWAIPFVYGAHYGSAVQAAEFLLLGTIFSAMTIVVDSLLQAYGHPGFVSVTQGTGGAVTVIGTVLLAGHPLSDVALVSSLGYAVAFALALIRLRMATRSPGEARTLIVLPGRPARRPGRHRRVARQRA